jgi:hypothetical protein
MHWENRLKIGCTEKEWLFSTSLHAPTKTLENRAKNGDFVWQK